MAFEKRNLRYHTDACKDGGKREDAERDGLSNHDCGYVRILWLLSGLKPGLHTHSCLPAKVLSAES